MTVRRQQLAFVAAALGLWGLLLFQAIESPVLLDDWFQLRYWRDHDFGLGAILAAARHNYLHYNPRIGEVWLAIIDGSRAIHVAVTPVVQLAVLPCVFVLALGRWPRRTLRDLQLLVFIQTLIWLVIPSPAIMYFYRPFAANYLWGVAITLALAVPYRLALAGAADAAARAWLIPIMLALGWTAGMCNEHTGPTAMVAVAIAVVAAWRMRRLRAWMVAGVVGLYVGYPMLFFAPGQSERYGGMATRYTPTTLLARRGLVGCIEIVASFAWEARLGFVVVGAAALAYVVTLRLRGERVATPSRRVLLTGGALTAAALAIVVTLFMSPTASGRVLLASGVLLVAAFAVAAERMLDEPAVRTAVMGACVVVAGYHVVRFVAATVELADDNAERIAIMRAAAPGTVAVVPRYRAARASRWVFGDDFVASPWLRDYVGGELYDLARVDLDRRSPERPSLAPPTYRALQAPWLRALFGGSVLAAHAVFDDPRHRPVLLLDGTIFVDGAPYDTVDRHFIRVERATLPPGVEGGYVIGCNQLSTVEIPGGTEDPLLPVDERYCRGPFTAIACAPDRCWVAGWY